MESSPIHTASAVPTTIAESDHGARAVLSPELQQLQRSLLHTVTTSDDEKSLLAAIGRVLTEFINLVVFSYCRRDEENEGQMSLTWRLIPGGPDRQSSGFERSILQLSELACHSGRTQLAQTNDDEGYLTIAAPVFHRNCQPDALAIVLPATARALERTLVTLQLVASHLTLWRVLRESSEVESEAAGNAALLELIGKTEGSEDVQRACYTLVCELQQYLGCETVAVGLGQGHQAECRLQAVSGTARFDRNSEVTRAYEAAFDEAVLRRSLATWPARSDSPRHASLALQKLAARMDAASAVSGPLFDDRAEPMGAWVFLGNEEFAGRDTAVNLIRAAQQRCGCCLELVRRAELGPVRKLALAAIESRRTWQGRAWLVAAIILVAILTIPVHYKIRCGCEMEAVARRFVAAPFDGKLEKSLVSPGQQVANGDALARMSGRQIRLELAELTAERGRVAKQRDVAMAAHDVAAAQLAQLDMERLDLNMQMLQRRAEHLVISSPIDGFVISGDHEKLEGAPLTTGQTLFEVAPMKQMVAEVAIPEDEVSFVQTNMDVTIHLDAFPRRVWRGTIANVHPRSENKDNENVFVAEVVLENPDALLQPGMKGRAKTIAGRRCLAWNLFHKSWDYIARMVGS